MSEMMVERVAQALYEATSIAIAEDDPGWAAAVPWPELIEKQKDFARLMARYAIAAMREPTEAVINALIISLGSDDDRSTTDKALDAWLAGNDAALGPGTLTTRPTEPG